MKKYRIFLGAQEIAGMMERLNYGFRQNGIDSDFYCMTNFFFKDINKSNNNSRIFRRFRKHVEKRGASSNKYVREYYEILKTIDILLLFIVLICKYNIFIYVFGHGLFLYSRHLKKHQEAEYKILKLFHKKMYMLLCGSDSRPPYCGVDIYDGDIERIYAATKEKAANIRMIEKYMTLIDNPASSQFHTKPYVIFQSIGIPIDYEERVKEENSQLNGHIVILHAPSNKAYKGTDIIRKIIEEIKFEGYDFEYVEIAGMKHEKVLEQLKRASLVVDELYSDTPMAGLGTEAAINRIPVITAGYYSECYKEYIPEPIPPTVFCSIEELKEKIIWLIGDEKSRLEIGQAEYEYVMQNCEASVVAKHFIELLSGKYPAEYWFIPKDNEYIWGCGITKEKVLYNICSLIDKYGEASLELDKNSQVFLRYMEEYAKAKRKEWEGRNCE